MGWPSENFTRDTVTGDTVGDTSWSENCIFKAINLLPVTRLIQYSRVGEVATLPTYAAKISDQFAVINFLIGIKVRFTEESDATVFGHVNQSSHVCVSPSNENVVT